MEESHGEVSLMRIPPRWAYDANEAMARTVPSKFKIQNSNTRFWDFYFISIFREFFNF